MISPLSNFHEVASACALEGGAARQVEAFIAFVGKMSGSGLHVLSNRVTVGQRKHSASWGISYSMAYDLTLINAR